MTDKPFEDTFLVLIFTPDDCFKVVFNTFSVNR